MAIKVLHENDKKKRFWGVVEIIIGILTLVVAAGLLITTEKYGLPAFALLTAIYMLIDARTKWL